MVYRLNLHWSICYTVRMTEDTDEEAKRILENEISLKPEEPEEPEAPSEVDVKKEEHIAEEYTD